MNTSTPLVFKPSHLHRTMALLLCSGSWLVGARALASLWQEMPRLHSIIVEARSAGEDPWLAWLLMTLSIAAVLIGGLLLVASILGLLIIEGTQVLVDELCISVELAYLPGPLAHWLGAGRLPWRHVSAIRRSGPFFIIMGDGRNPEDSEIQTLDPIRFLMVDELERLVNLVIERSPNLSFKD